jgi:hypothetical protein
MNTRAAVSWLLARCIVMLLVGVGCAGQGSVRDETRGARGSTEDTPTSIATTTPTPIATIPSGDARAAATAVALEGAREARTIRGRVQRIEPGRGTSGLDAWTQVVTDGGDFRLLLEPNGYLPFAVQDVIDAAVDCTRGGFHLVCDVVVRDDTGAVLLIISGSGADLVPGWTVELGAAGEHFRGRVTHGLIVRYAGQTVTVPADTWVRITEPAGAWLVTGRAVRWTGTRPPDAVDHQTYAISRVP